VSTTAAAGFSGSWQPEVDLPQVGYQDPPDHLEAYWMYGYDPASHVGHYLYLAAEKGDVMLRRESVFLLLPDGSVLAQGGSGRNSRGAVAAGDRLRLECLEPFRRWHGRYAGPVYRLIGDEIVAGPRPGSELVDVTVDIEVESVAAPWNTEGDWGERPPSLRYHQFYEARGTVESQVPDTRSPDPGSAVIPGAVVTHKASPATPSSTVSSPAAAASACCATGRPPTGPSAAGASSTSRA